jgi:hypothetical protein
MKQVRKIALWFVGVGFAVTGTVFIYLLVVANQPPAGARAEQDRIVAAIQAFRDQHGRLPDSLEEVGIEFDRNIFDGVCYWKVFTNPNEFTLSCDKSYWSPAPRMHWWYYHSNRGTWEYENEGI